MVQSAVTVATANIDLYFLFYTLFTLSFKRLTHPFPILSWCFNWIYAEQGLLYNFWRLYSQQMLKQAQNFGWRCWNV